MGCYHQVTRVHIMKMWPFYDTFWTADLLHSNLVWMYILYNLCKSRASCKKSQIAVFKVKVTENVQKLIQCLSVLYFLYHWSHCNQPRGVDLLLLITRPNANKVSICTDSNTGYTVESILLHSGGKLVFWLCTFCCCCFLNDFFRNIFYLCVIQKTFPRIGVFLFCFPAWLLYTYFGKKKIIM